MEPEALLRGKAFHRRVQREWAGEIENATVRSEHGILLGPIPETRTHERRGRIDIFVDLIDDFVSVVELKSTDWDRIGIPNRQRLLSAHCRFSAAGVTLGRDGRSVPHCWQHGFGCAGRV